MALKDIFCQDKAIKNLMSAYKADRVPHAYIFSGPEGIGKQATAKQWAKLLLCEEPQKEENTFDSCGKCRSCKLFEANSHSDYQLVYKELKQYTEKGKESDKPPVEMPIDVVREFLIEKASQRPTHSDRKVFVLLEAEKLNKSSQNALLKTLEEPPSYCNIILICTKLQTLLATTKSRSQIITFSPISEDIIAEKLTEKAIEKQKALYLARLSSGSLGKALQYTSLPDIDLFSIKKEIVKKITSFDYERTLYIADDLMNISADIAKSFGKVEENISKSDLKRRAHKLVISIIISIFSDLMKLDLVKNEQLTNFDQINHIRRLTSNIGPQQAAVKVSDLYRNLKWVDASVNEKLIFQQLLLNLFDFDRITAFY